MGTKSREYLCGSSIRYSAEKAKLARQEADKLACETWTLRMPGYKGRAQPSPTLGDTLNAGCRYLEVRCLGCNTLQTVALDIVRRPKTTPIHELERYMRCKDCSEVRRYPLQAQPSGRASRRQDHGERSAFDVVAGRAVNDDEEATMNGSRYYVVRSEGTKYGMGFGSALHQLHHQQVDPLGDHPRYSRLAVCDLLRTVPVVAFPDVQPLFVPRTKPPSPRCFATSTATRATSHRCRACFPIIRLRWSATRAANSN